MNLWVFFAHARSAKLCSSCCCFEPLICIRRNIVESKGMLHIVSVTFSRQLITTRRLSIVPEQSMTSIYCWQTGQSRGNCNKPFFLVDVREHNASLHLFSSGQQLTFSCPHTMQPCPMLKQLCEFSRVKHTSQQAGVNTYTQLLSRQLHFLIGLQRPPTEKPWPWKACKKVRPP